MELEKSMLFNSYSLEEAVNNAINISLLLVVFRWNQKGRLYLSIGGIAR